MKYPLLTQVLQASSNKIPSEVVHDHLDAMSNLGEYLDNQHYEIGLHDFWELKRIPISKIDFTLDQVSLPESQKLIDQYLKLGSEPPAIIVVLDDSGLYRIVDGYHRVGVAVKRGIKDILAYAPI